MKRKVSSVFQRNGEWENETKYLTQVKDKIQRISGMVQIMKNTSSPKHTPH